MKKSLNKLFEESFRKNWDRPALTNYQGLTITYAQMSRQIALLHTFYEKWGIKPGDNIAVCSKNQVKWGVSFLSAITYGAVVVPILSDFKPVNIQHLLRHSSAKIIFMGEAIWKTFSVEDMPDLKFIIKMEDFTVLYSRDGAMEDVFDQVEEPFAAKFPKGFGPDTLRFFQDEPSGLAMINYTSGTSGFSKGVMLPYRSIMSNIQFAFSVHPQMTNQSKVVSLLPSAHMYGMIFEFLYEMAIGANTFFLTRLPSPRVILEAFATVKPDVVIAVPLIIEKIYKQKLVPIINSNRFKALFNLPGINIQVKKRIREELVESFGGQFGEVIIGGAAFNREAEAFFKNINFPFTIGYGMTECGPIITYVPWNKTKLYSCGKAAPRMQIKVDSPDPRNIPGEILVKGDNLFCGYYRNEEATREAFTKNGWFRTGDMGVIDRDGYLFLKGRCKSMILGPSGQNIYPEEIESSINNLPYVIESLVLDQDGILKTLIFPDYELAARNGYDNDRLLEHFKEDMKIVNVELPSYSQVLRVELVAEEFEKTPKRSIKRYLYQEQ